MNGRFARISILAILLASAESIFCSHTDVECVCTADFREITLVAVDASSDPVTDLDIKVKLIRTGEILNITQSQWSIEDGRYTVFHDGLKHIIRRKIIVLNEELEVTGAGGAGSFEARFEVSVDTPCACHVYKVSGPDTVVVVN